MEPLVQDCNFYDIPIPQNVFIPLNILEFIINLAINTDANMNPIEVQIQYLKHQLSKICQIQSPIEQKTNVGYLNLMLQFLKPKVKHDQKQFFNDLERFQKSLELYESELISNASNASKSTKKPIPPPPPPMPLPPPQIAPSETRKLKYPIASSLMNSPIKRIPNSLANSLMSDKMQSELLKGRQRLKVVQMQRTPSGSPKNKPKPTVITWNDYFHQELKKKFADAQ